MHMDAFMCSKHKIEAGRMHERLHVNVFKVELLFNFFARINLLYFFSDFET